MVQLSINKHTETRFIPQTKENVSRYIEDLTGRPGLYFPAIIYRKDDLRYNTKLVNRICLACFKETAG